MKKLAALLVLTMALALTGCNENKKPEASKPETSVATTRSGASSIETVSGMAAEETISGESTVNVETVSGMAAEETISGESTVNEEIGMGEGFDEGD